MRNSAGRRARRGAWTTRRATTATSGWRYIPGVVVYCWTASIFILYLAWTIGAEAAWFTCGLGVGSSLLLVWITADFLAAARHEIAGYAEQWTENEIRKLRRSGWQVVSNIPFEHCDVDHVAIGPAGVVVLETKWTDGSLFTKRGSLSNYGFKALDQVEDGATKIGHVLAQGGYTAGVNGRLVVIWGFRVPGEPLRITGRKGAVIAGKRLADFLATKPTRLSTAEIETATAALESWLTHALLTRPLPPRAESEPTCKEPSESALVTTASKGSPTTTISARRNSLARRYLTNCRQVFAPQLPPSIASEVHAEPPPSSFRMM